MKFDLNPDALSRFQKFTTPYWTIFGGQLIMLLAITFYIIWWVVSKGDITSAGTGSYLTMTLLCGVAAVALLFFGINLLPQTDGGIPVRYILAGALTLLIILFPATTIFLKRAVTSELPLILFWAALECSAITALHQSRFFSVKKALALVALVGMATGVGLACYIVHYHLDEAMRFRNGLIPLVADGVVVMAMVAAMAHASADNAANKRSAVRR
jgi:hypothetical protein